VTWQGGQVSALAPLLTGTTTTQLPPGALSAGSCTSPATVTVNGATVGSPVTANLTSGSPPYGAFQVQAFVSTANTVSVQACAIVNTTVPSGAYFNVAVQ
jgi:hypothetical protein